MGKVGISWGVAALVLMAISARAAEPPPAAEVSIADVPWYSPSEVALGAGADDPFEGIERSADLSGVVRLQPIGDPNSFFFFHPRPEFGVNINLQGKTSVAYTGFEWTFFKWHHISLGGDFGGAIHDGRLHKETPDLLDRKELGSRFEFHEGFILAYQLTKHYGLEAWLDHISNAGLAKVNQGLETSGIRATLKF
jgi:lipid A 3-O-deacylase